MSLDKAIKHGKEHRKKYFGSKAFDGTCRNHGTGFKRNFWIKEKPEALSFRLFFYAKKLGRRGDIGKGHSFKILLSK